MMWLAKAVLGLPGLASGVLGYLNKRADSGVAINGANVAGDVAVNQAALQAYVEERKVIAAARAADRGSLWTAWMIPTAFGLAMLHFGAIVLDSVLHLGLAVAKLPAPYDQMQWQIVMAVIGVSGAAGMVRKIFAK